MRFNNQNQPKPGEPSPVWIKELRFTSLQDNSTIRMSHYGTNASTTTPVLEYSRDGEIWTPWFFETLTVNKGDYVLFRGNNPNGISSSTSDYSTLTGSGSFALDGNIMSILYANDYTERFAIPANYCFYSLFRCYDYETRPSFIKNAENLILQATTLTNYCYSGMFIENISLLKIPNLPAENLKSGCYASMFDSCSLIEETKELPAINLPDYCYNGMFANCISIKKVNNFYGSTFDFRPIEYMFYNTPNLQEIYLRSTNWNSSYGFHGEGWLTATSESGTIYCYNNLNILENSERGIPTGWTRVDITE